MSKIAVLVAGLTFFIVPLFWLSKGLKEQLVEKKGIIVQVKIVRMPTDCLSTRRQKLYFSFEYEGKVYSKQLGSLFCEKYKVGDIIDMRHLNDFEDIFLFSEESVILELISTIALSSFGLFVLIKYSVIGTILKSK
jgi:hypothetical protein